MQVPRSAQVDDVTDDAPVNWVNDHGELSFTTHTRLLAYDSKPGTAEHASCDVVRHDVQVILRRSIPGKSPTAMRLHGLANLARAFTKGVQE